MNTTKIHTTLVVLASLVYALPYLFLREYWITLFALAIGVCWLLVEKYKIEVFFNLFFIGFVWLAVHGCLSGLPLPLMLLGVCINLAAWDLTRFQDRLRKIKIQNPEPRLVKGHLQNLLLTLCLGYILALIPTMIQLSMNLVVMIILALFLLFTLRKSVITLRSDKND
ncbi:MAG: hypothetical protein JW908_07020 [Anaerolineales bacterium]|nr:hypothetical protein [Anaerolineales bacterium]